VRNSFAAGKVAFYEYAYGGYYLIAEISLSHGTYSADESLYPAMAFPIHYQNPPQVAPKPPIVQFVTREDVLWNRPIFRAPRSKLHHLGSTQKHSSPHPVPPPRRAALER
jgi:hypothetical protein